MIKRLILLVFLLFMLNLSYQPLYRTAVRYKTPVAYTVKVDTDEYTGLLIKKNKEFYRSEKIFLYICLHSKDISNSKYYNSS